MAQHDYVIANGTGAAVRSDLNNALAAIVSQNSGATAPSPTYAYQFWADTTTGLLKLRNAANSAWITLFQLDGEWSTLPVENGTAAAPSIYFKDSGTDTGFYSPGTDQVGISTAGTSRLTIDSNGNVNIDSNTLYVDAANNRVGVGNSSPGDVLHVKGSSTYAGVIADNSAATGGGAFRAYRNGTQKAIFCADSWVTGTSSDDAAIYADAGGGIKFYTNNSSAAKAYLTSGGSLGVGTTSPQSLLHLETDGTALRIVRGSSIGFAYNTGTASTDPFRIQSNGGAVDLYSAASQPITFSAGTTEKARIDSSGRLLVGTSSARSTVFTNNSPQFQVEGTSAATSMASIIANSNDTGQAYFVLGKTRGTSIGSNTVVQSGDYCGTVSFQGVDGSKFVECARIDGVVDGTPGTNDMPGRLVFSTTADGASSPTERMRITSNGVTKLSNYGSYVATTDNTHEINTNNSGNSVIHIVSRNASFAADVTVSACLRSANSAYKIFGGYSGDGSSAPFNDVEFNLRGDGNGYADGTWTGGGADYAEYFEWSDSNADAEDRRGISVVLDGDKIREAVAGEDPIGVISGNPSVVGDAAWNKWSGKYLRDEFGSYLLDENGDRQLNPAYDPDAEYIPREQRPEWDCVGLMGKLRIRKGQVTGSRWIKMRDISNTVEEWLVR